MIKTQYDQISNATKIGLTYLRRHSRSGRNLLITIAIISLSAFTSATNANLQKLPSLHTNFPIQPNAYYSYGMDLNALIRLSGDDDEAKLTRFDTGQYLVGKDYLKSLWSQPHSIGEHSGYVFRRREVEEPLFNTRSASLIQELTFKKGAQTQVAQNTECVEGCNGLYSEQTKACEEDYGYQTPAYINCQSLNEAAYQGCIETCQESCSQVQHTN